MRRKFTRLLAFVVLSVLLIRTLTQILLHSFLMHDSTRNEIETLYIKDSKLNSSANTTRKSIANKDIKHPRRTRQARGKVNVYTYKDVCSYTDTYNLYWNPLFPKYPYSTYFASKLEDDELLPETISRRFVGYIYMNTTGYYTFEMQSRNGIEFVLYEEKISREKIIARYGIYDRDIREQSVINPPLFRRVSEEVLLQKDRRYVIDLVQTVFFSGRFLLRFKIRNGNHYSPLAGDHIGPYTNLRGPVPINYFFKAQSLLRDSFRRNAKLLLRKARLNSGTLSTGLLPCPYTPSYLFAGKELKLYVGLNYVKQDVIYPDDQTSTSGKPLDANAAKKIARDVFNAINIENQRIYKLENIVHVEENHEKRRYFVEIDLQNTIDGKSYRFSDYFLKTTDNKQFCLPDGYASKWRHKAPIYLVCTVKNQKQWFQYLIQSIEELIKRTNDNNLHLIVVDFHSTDANVKVYLQRSTLNYTFLQMKGNFSKVKGLNEGVRHIPTNDSIVFVMDLHLQIPDHIFDQARKHTIEGKMAYSPTLLRLQCGEHPEYTKLHDSIWMDLGYGMISIYKSDWERIGGMNEDMFSYKWGGEDWEFVDRVIKAKLELVHQRLPGFYHIHHSTVGTWDGTKKF